MSTPTLTQGGTSYAEALAAASALGLSVRAIDGLADAPVAPAPAPDPLSTLIEGMAFVPYTDKALLQVMGRTETEAAQIAKLVAAGRPAGWSEVRLMVSGRMSKLPILVAPDADLFSELSDLERAGGFSVLSVDELEPAN